MPKEPVAEKEVAETIDNNTLLGIYLDVYKTQWEDIHHTRNQDWEFSKLILAGFVGLSGLTAFTKSTTLIVTLAIAFMIFSCLGILVTLRHKRLFDEKMKAIRILEKHLQIDKLELFTKKKKRGILGIIPLPSTQICLVAIYILSFGIFTLFLLVELKIIG